MDGTVRGGPRLSVAAVQGESEARWRARPAFLECFGSCAANATAESKRMLELLFTHQTRGPQARAVGRYHPRPVGDRAAQQVSGA